MSRKRNESIDDALNQYEKAREGKLDMMELESAKVQADGYADVDDEDIADIKKRKKTTKEIDEEEGDQRVQTKLVIEEVLKPQASTTLVKEEAVEHKVEKIVKLVDPKSGKEVKPKVIVGTKVNKVNKEFYYFDIMPVPESVGSLFLVGKVLEGSVYKSACLIIKGIPKILFFEPKPDNKAEDVVGEINDIITKQKKMRNAKMKIETKEMIINPEDNGEDKEKMMKKIIRGVSVEFVNRNESVAERGKTYKAIHQKTLTSEEILLSLYSIKGPSWISIKNAEEVGNELLKKSWACKEYILNLEDKTCELKTLEQKAFDPPMNVCSLSAVSVLATSAKQPQMVSIDIIKNVNITQPMKTWKEEIQTFYISQKNAKCAGKFFLTSEEVVKQIGDIFQIYDIDIVISHDFITHVLPFFDVINRSSKIVEFSTLGRLKRTKTGVNFSKKDLKEKNFSGRNFMSGRLLVDTYVLSKEYLRGEKVNDLDVLVSNYLKKERKETVDLTLSSAELFDFMNTPEGLEHMRKYQEENVKFQMELANKMNVIAMTKVLTNLAGNIWSHTLNGQRAERVEYLLLHEFMKRRSEFVIPDKRYLEGQQHKKYAGGLVLEPVKQFYNDPVLLIDFKSLYPSIIMEFAVCFTNNTIGDKSGKCVLPEIISKLVKKRRALVAEMEKLGSNEENKKAQMNTEQLSVKVMTNSIYGCLGFKGGRFYCQKIAEWITKKGRQILTATYEQVQESGYSVVYGDTDSLMVKPETRSLKETYKVGEELCKLINNKYTSLEIEIDAVFSKLLLLKKKRYAAIMVNENGETKRELKGLDVVRREWCLFSKEIGNYCINLILKDEGKEKTLHDLENYFKKIASDLRGGKVDIAKLVIVKGLSKDPKEYAQKTIEHVSAALKSTKEYKAGDQVKFVIRQNLENENVGVVERALPLDQIEKFEHFQIDYEYYLENQIFAPVSRIFEVFSGMNNKIREWIGLRQIQSLLVKASGERGGGVELECLKCKEKFLWEGYKEKDMKCHCEKCKNVFESTELVVICKAAMDAVFSEYLDQTVKCTECGKIVKKSEMNGEGFECCGEFYEFAKNKTDVMKILTDFYVVTSYKLNGMKEDSDIAAVHRTVETMLDKPFLQRGYN
ncbi:DNA polymerase, putative [Entamoeba invadens IP1]|uniref:DNA polymerase n=1 Tax=Entamoeba invadens IP1 TaxID=370355 RepID=A0A0A1U4H2_ENTIV|nr:DNA polymerase, putative [Entamoeba invadens IP1]ELP86600.1 DNA polymerase, putative [Entamoeba invadens IP1]|eukprot:XP_004185946.1 DNA polymerase, putative [Entamoeba invadens IP1]